MMIFYNKIKTFCDIFELLQTFFGIYKLNANFYSISCFFI